MLLAAVVQAGVLFPVAEVMSWLESDADRVLDRTTSAALVIAVVQIARTAVLAFAILVWLQIVKPRLLRSWRGIAVLVCLVGVTFFPGAAVFFGLAMLIPIARLKWTHEIHGWIRFGLVFALVLVNLLLLVNVQTTLSDGQVLNQSTGISSDRSVTLLEGDLPSPAAEIIRLSEPWGHAVRVMVTLLQVQFLVAFLQMLVLPIRLRGLSLKRRFTVTLAMYRFIPGTLALVFVIMIVYLGIGLHRAGIAQKMFRGTLDQGLRVADGLLAAASAEDSNVLMSVERWMTGDRGGTFAVVRDAERTPAPEDSTTEETTWAASIRAVSPDAPDGLLEGRFFGDAVDDSSVGLAEVEGALYLRSARARVTGEKALLAEVFVRVDSLYLARIAHQIRSDVRIDVSPNVFIGESSVTVGGNEEAWSDSAFTLIAPFAPDAGRSSLWKRKLYLARSFIATGNWLMPLGENNLIGAVQLKLYTSPQTLLESLTGNALAITSNAFAILIFIAMGLLFGIVELSAVRTGRSIIKGIVTDVKRLSEAARRYGDGDLSHRVDMGGTDEIGKLAMTFNTMAENIEQHQEVLLEKERLEADLAVARDIQQRMLPQSAPVIPGLDVAGISIPSREVGGDLFYFLPVSDGKLGLTIGDVSGKSVPAALLMSNVLAALKSEARLIDEEDKILTHLNRLITEQVEPGRFVTFFYGVVDPANKTLRFACAGHNPPLIIRRSGEREWLHEAGVPLGIMADSTYSPAQVSLENGDVLVLYSDGVTEAQRALSPTPQDGEDEPREDEFFDEDRLVDAVGAVRKKSAAEIVGHVVETVRDFTDGADLSDDLTLVVVKFVPA
jgi:serine phosphatase RsbU (regulator of sigma subunit)